MSDTAFGLNPTCIRFLDKSWLQRHSGMRRNDVYLVGRIQAEGHVRQFNKTAIVLTASPIPHLFP